MKVHVILGKDVKVFKTYEVSTQEDARTLYRAIDDAQGYEDYGIVGDEAEGDVVASCEDVDVVLEDLGEGRNGEYDESDPEDVPLLRFTVFKDGEQVEDASYCTTIPTSASRAEQFQIAFNILSQVYEDVQAGNSVKKLCESLSHINL